MKDISFSRRAVMLGAAALPLAQRTGAQARPKPLVIASGNGVRSLRQGDGTDQGAAATRWTR